MPLRRISASISGQGANTRSATYSSWRWIFLVNIPVGIAGVLLVLRFVPADTHERYQPLDKIGFILTGFALAFARGVGEYGSVIFIAGNMPMKSEIAPLLIITKLEQYDYSGATAIAVVMLVLSFALMLGINALQSWASTRHGAA